jgi:hypothetical protein
MLFSLKSILQVTSVIVEVSQERIAAMRVARNNS